MITYFAPGHLAGSIKFVGFHVVRKIYCQLWLRT